MKIYVYGIPNETVAEVAKLIAERSSKIVSNEFLKKLSFKNFFSEFY